MVESFIPDYKQADTEVRKTNVRFQRKAATAKFFAGQSGGLRFQDWIGKVSGLVTESDGEAALSVSLIESGIVVKTWTNSFSDSAVHTMISRDQALYQSLTNVREGDNVTVSGSFLPLDNAPDYIEEASVTEEGSMTTPEFIVRFSQIKVGLPEATAIPQQIINVDSTTLLSAYQTNEDAAKALYENKKATVTGVLTGVFVPSIDASMRLAKKGLPAYPFVTMGGPRPSSAEDAFFLPGITAHSETLFGQQDAAAFADRMRVGETVTLACTCKGGMRSSDLSGTTPPNDTPDYQITLEDCTLQVASAQALNGITLGSDEATSARSIRNSIVTTTKSSPVAASEQSIAPSNPSYEEKEITNNPPIATAPLNIVRSNPAPPVGVVGNKGKDISESPPIPGFTRYKNDKFGFSIDYPQDLGSPQNVRNSDGATFQSKDGNARLLLDAHNNLAQLTLRDYLRLRKSAIRGRILYKEVGNDWFVIVWKDKDKRGYLKMFVGSGSVNAFSLTFPESWRPEYDEVLANMERSFKPGDTGRDW